MHLPLTSQFAEMEANDLDLSDPSTFQSQLTFVCGQLAVTDEKDLAILQFCTPQVAQKIADAKKNCENPIDNFNGFPGSADDTPEYDCTKAITMVRFKLHCQKKCQFIRWLSVNYQHGTIATYATLT